MKDLPQFLFPMIIGNRNCGKSFIIKPLSKIYGKDAFQNPARNNVDGFGPKKLQLSRSKTFDGQATL